MKFNTIEELLHYTEAIKGKTFKEIDSKHLLENATNLKRNKGILGHVVESGFYKYPINSNPQADFDKIGVELKVTGYKKNKKGEKSAKERVSLSKIDFNKIVNEEYEYSKLIYKNKKILFIW
ncbi:MutH/Sau3AI family endonuclease [uncultured Methanobrevibacter sp.]|uniref:MutH/Sau3AI family endonuclease n=1 Tax=uncultured Methanobrevibacter sp. TaxID=253161 RepID=UPI0026360058|nr:MutH/Sau3AI family endonuclease [uncultured Methanobrevibacter sp.]